MTSFCNYDVNHQLNRHNKVASVKTFLESGEYDAFFCLDKWTDDDAFYRILRDGGDRFTFEQICAVLALFANHRNGIVFNNGRAMFECLWRLTSYRRNLVPLVGSLVTATAWQEIATMLIKYDRIPQDHFPRLIRMCLVFGAWALLDEQKEQLEVLWKGHCDRLSSWDKPWSPVFIDFGDATLEVMPEQLQIALVEAYACTALKFVKRDILDLLRDEPTRSDEEIAAQSLCGSFDIGEYGFNVFVSTMTAREIVQSARSVFLNQQGIHLAAEIDAL